MIMINIGAWHNQLLHQTSAHEHTAPIAINTCDFAIGLGLYQNPAHVWYDHWLHLSAVSSSSTLEF
jgi:hypothetical protein